jgi:hypothetical protein
MATTRAAADAGAYEERSLFVRKATGLVRGWAVRDAFIYSVFAINLVTLGFYIFSFGPSSCPAPTSCSKPSPTPRSSRRCRARGATTSG